MKPSLLSRAFASLLLTVFVAACSSGPKGPPVYYSLQALDSKTRQPFQVFYEKDGEDFSFYRGTPEAKQPFFEASGRSVFPLTEERVWIAEDKTNFRLLDLKSGKNILRLQSPSSGWGLVQNLQFVFLAPLELHRMQRGQELEVTYIPYFSEKPRVLRVGGAGAWHDLYVGRNTQASMGLAEILMFGCGANICVNRVENGQTVGMVMDLDGRTLTDNLAPLGSLRTYTAEKVARIPTERWMVIEAVARVGEYRDGNLLRHIYQPIGPDGRPLKLPDGIQGVVPIYDDQDKVNLGWLLIRSHGTSGVEAFAHVGSLAELPANPLELPLVQKAKAFTTFKENHKFYNILAQRTDNKWVVLPNGDTDMKQVVQKTYEGEEKLAQEQILSDFHATFFANRPGKKEEYERERRAIYARVTAEVEARKAQEQGLRDRWARAEGSGRVCEDFEAAKFVGTSALNIYLQRCRLTEAQHQEIRHLGVDRTLLERQFSRIVAEGNERMIIDRNNQMRADAQRRNRYSPADGGASGTQAVNAPKAPPSQNLNQQQRYEYNKQLDKNIRRAVGQ